jgi:hypothetical protein
MKLLAWFALYLSLAFALLLPLSAHSGSRLPDDGDAVLTVWTLWWSATHLTAGYPGILDANTFHPHPRGLLYSEPLLGQGLIGWPLFLITENPIFATNALMILTLAWSALAAQLLLRELTGSTAGAVVGAIVFTFSAYTFSQLARIQLITLQWLPLALWCLHRYYTRSQKSYLAGFAVFSILQGLSCLYYLAFYLVGLGILFPAYLYAYPEHRELRSLGWVGASGLSVGAALALVTIPYLVLYGHYGFTSEPASYDLIGYFVPRSQNLLYSALDLRPTLVDHFIGYFVTAIALVGLIALARKPRSEARTIGLAYFVVALVGFVLSAGPKLSVAGVQLGAGPFALLQTLGPYQNLRAPDRFSLLVTLGVSVLVAYGVARLLAHRSRGVSVAGCGLLCLVVLTEHWSPRRVRGAEVPAGDDVPEVYRWLGTSAAGETGPIAELPPRPFREMRHVTFDGYFSAFHGRKGLFNKPSFYPPAVELLQYELSSFPSRDSLTLLRAIGVSHVVVHPKRWPTRARPTHRARLERFAEATLIEAFPDRDDPQWDALGLGGEYVVALAPLDADDEGSPRECDCREIPRETLRLDANGANRPRLAIDGDRRTKWTTGATQRKGHFFEIAFDRPRRPVRIELEMAFPYGEFPRHLEVNGFRDERAFRLRRLPDVWHTVALVRQLVDDPSRARMRIDLEPESVERIRLFINVEEEGSQPWSVFEIHVYEPTDPNVLEFPARP